MRSDKNERKIVSGQIVTELRENVAGKNVRERTIGFGQVENSA